MRYVLFDSQNRDNLLPMTHTRPMAGLRCGIFTMQERWEKLLESKADILSFMVSGPAFEGREGDTMYVNAAVAGTENMAKAISALKENSVLRCKGSVIAFRNSKKITEVIEIVDAIRDLESVHQDEEIFEIKALWDLFSLNDALLKQDYQLLTKGRTSEPIPEGVSAIAKENIFLEVGAKVLPGTVLNTESGPIYIAASAEIMEGCLIRGPFAALDGSIVKMGAKIYGATTIGPGCRAGGELNNVVMMANSNKGHDGFLGNAVLGEWCNIGADTNCSNLKNNYDEVKIWNEANMKSVRTGLTFCGLIMADHSKCGINTMFNTGTVVGVSCNIYGGGFPEKFVPSFSWGGSDGMVTYDLQKAIDTAGRMMGRRHKELSPEEQANLKHVFDQTAGQRKIFNRD